MSDSSRPGAARSPIARTTHVVFAAAVAVAAIVACALPAGAQTTSTSATAADPAVATLRAEADQIATKYFAAMARAQALDTEIAASKAEIDDLEARAEKAREAARDRAVVAYRQSGSRLAAMVDGDDVLDAARRARLIDQVNEQDQATFSRLHNLSEDLREQRKALEASRAEHADALAALQTQANAIDAKLAEAARREATQKAVAATAATSTTSAGAAGTVAPAATTPTTAPAAPSTTQPAPPPTNPVPAPPPPAGIHPHHDDPFLACVRARESGGYYGAVSPGGTYRGAYQFAQTTWNATANHAGRSSLVGVQPNTASVYDQDDMAWTLYQWQGMGPWGGSC